MVDHGPIQVMIVDDHAVVRSGLSASLMALDDLEFVGGANGGAEAVGKCQGSEKLIDRSPAPKLRRWEPCHHESMDVGGRLIPETKLSLSKSALRLVSS